MRRRVLRATLGILVIASAAAPSATRADGPQSRAGPPRPTAGTSYEYAWDAQGTGHTERAWSGLAYVHPDAAADKTKPVPLLVFIHGLNRELIKHRWMGGGNEGDVRRVVQDLIDKKLIEPIVVAGPSSIIPSTVVDALTSWPAFDVDNFIARTRERLAGTVTIDPNRIMVAGHSGAGCNDAGGLATAAHGKTHLFAVLSIDTCMGPGLARKLLASPPDTSVVVAWQMQSWSDRPFSEFKRQFKHDLALATPPPTALRELDPVQVKEGMPHDAIVHLTLEKWLPRLLKP